MMKELETLVYLEHGVGVSISRDGGLYSAVATIEDNHFCGAGASIQDAVRDCLEQALVVAQEHRLAAEEALEGYQDTEHRIEDALNQRSTSVRIPYSM